MQVLFVFLTLRNVVTQGHSPQAVALSRGIAQKLGELQSLVNAGIATTEKSGGSRKPAPTVAGKAEQAQKWLTAPEADDGGLGGTIL